MPKKIVEDVLPPPRRSIRNVPLSESKILKESRKAKPRRVSSSANAAAVSSSSASAPTVSNNNEEFINTDTRYSEETTPARQRARVEIEDVETPARGGGFGRKFVFIGGVFIVVALVVYFSSVLFVRATVKVSPKKWPVHIDSSLTVAKDGAQSATQVGDPLNYNVITLTEEATREVVATGEQEVQEKASGDIIIFNDQSEASQVLIKNTRFQTPSGLVFRIQDAVTVPGRKTVAGKTTPGMLKVKIYADAAGEKYNVGLADFTIPGFSGDARFKTITAKSDPQSPIKGGFIGKVKKAKDSDIQLASASMEKELATKLKARAIAQAPEGQVFFESGSSISYENVPVAASADASASGKAIVKKKATLTGALFSQEELMLALSKSTNFPKDALLGPVAVEGLEDISFVFKEKNEANLLAGKPIQFDIDGDISLVAGVDPQNISNALAGKKRSDFNTVLSSDDSIAAAELTTYPGWARSLPRSAGNIKVEIVP